MEDYYNTRDNEDCWLFWITYIKVNKIISSSCLVAVFTKIWVAKVTFVQQKNLEGITDFKKIKAVRIKQLVSGEDINYSNFYYF